MAQGDKTAGREFVALVKLFNALEKERSREINGE